MPTGLGRATPGDAVTKIAENAGRLRPPSVVRCAVRSIGETPVLVGHDWPAPFINDVQIVGRLAGLERAAVVSIAAAYEVPLIWRDWVNARRVLVHALASEAVVRISGTPGHPVACRSAFDCHGQYCDALEEI